MVIYIVTGRRIEKCRRVRGIFLTEVEAESAAGPGCTIEQWVIRASMETAESPRAAAHPPYDE